MPRNLDPSLYATLQSNAIEPFFMAQLSFKTAKENVWSGVGNLIWSGLTFTGVGSFCKVGAITEGVDVQAYGTSVTLSGIDPVFLGDALTEMVPGAQATLWFGVMTNGSIVGSPYVLYNGTMDKASVSVAPESISITLPIENRMLDLSRASNRRYTSADQRLYYPTDTAFGWVEQLNDLALVWGA